MGRVQIQRTNGQWYWAEYSTFSISNEVGKYRLTVAGYSGDAGDALAGHVDPAEVSNGKMFTTVDRDNDDDSSNNCATYTHLGGWWYAACSASVVSRDDDAPWQTVGVTYDVQASRMLLKLNDVGCYHSNGQSQWVKCQEPHGTSVNYVQFQN